MKNTNTKKALLVGSVVYDVLFELTSSINEQIRITNGMLGVQNLMFNAKNKEVFFGGPSGNIAYGLSLLKQKSVIASIAGKDFTEYAGHLRRLGIKQRISIIKNGHTAMYYGMTDASKQQMGVFQGGSYHAHLPYFSVSKLLKKNDWKNIGVGIFSPGTAKSIIRDMREFRAAAPLGAAAILDPGQMLAVDFTPVTLIQAIRSADIFILNDTEAHFMRTVFKISHEKLWELGLNYFIVTHGERGSVLHTRDGIAEIMPQKAKKVVDPTGAGDAFRAGLIHGLLSGKSIPESMKIGARLGVRCVEKKGGQTYRI